MERKPIFFREYALPGGSLETSKARNKAKKDMDRIFRNLLSLNLPFGHTHAKACAAGEGGGANENRKMTFQVRIMMALTMKVIAKRKSGETVK